jgi:hypothetical protein
MTKTVAMVLQREFARRLTGVEALKTAQRGSLAERDALSRPPAPRLARRAIRRQPTHNQLVAYQDWDDT